MGSTITFEEELPLPANEFASRLIDDIDTYIDEHDLTDSRFEEQLTEQQVREGLYSRVYNELAGVDLARRMAEQTDNDRLFIQLMKQVEDEAKHARLLAQRLVDLGGNPSEVWDRPENQGFMEMFEGLDFLETAVTLQCTAERTARLRHMNEHGYYDKETARLYEDVITPDEKFHAQVGVNVLQTCDSLKDQHKAVETARFALEEYMGKHDSRVKNAYPDAKEAESS